MEINCPTCERLFLIGRLPIAGSPSAYPTIDFEKALLYYQQESGKELSPGQRDAYKLALSSRDLPPYQKEPTESEIQRNRIGAEQAEKLFLQKRGRTTSLLGWSIIVILMVALIGFLFFFDEVNDVWNKLWATKTPSASAMQAQNVTTQNPQNVSTAQASQDEMNRFSALVHADKHTEAKTYLDGLLKRHPNDETLLKMEPIMEKLLLATAPGELQVSCLKIYQSSPVHTSIDVEIYNNSELFLSYYQVAADIYSRTGEYLGHSDCNGANLRAKQSATKEIIFRDIKANDVGDWKLNIAKLSNTNIDDVTANFKLTVEQTVKRAISASGKHTPEQIDAIKHFAFQGIALGATLPQIKAKYPDIQRMSILCDAQALKEVWTRGFFGDLNVYYDLYNGGLYDIQIEYPENMVDNMGGYEAIYNKLVGDYGKEDKDTTESEGPNKYSKPIKLCEWSIQIGSSDEETIHVMFAHGFGPFSLDKTTYTRSYRTSLSITDMKAFGEELRKKEESQRELQKNANVGF